MQKNGELLPGSKGIALSLEQFQILKAAASDVTAALASKDVDFKVALSSKYGQSLMQPLMQYAQSFTLDFCQAIFVFS